jgi:hypothetical protein
MMELQQFQLVDEPTSQQGINTFIPPGLEQLVSLDQISIKQKIQRCPFNNMYSIKAPTGEKCLDAIEDSDYFSRTCLGRSRPFNMRIRDLHDKHVAHVSRDFRWGLQKLDVSCPPGIVVASVNHELSWTASKYRIANCEGQTILRINGPPPYLCCMCGTVEFKLLTPDESIEIGSISKEWGGIFRENCTNADKFIISFPIDLDVRMKVALIGACFLIDFMFFEHK